MVVPEEVLARFHELYGSDGNIMLFDAPGRVNIIGEHTDYNDGFVLPVAISLDTVAVARRRSDATVRVYSMNKDREETFSLSEKKEQRERSWLNYVEGMARVLVEEGARLSGADIVLSSDIPGGAGLSSSAALETVTALALLMLNDIPVDRRRIPLMAQRAEHEYVGTKCGIMDQFICSMAEQGDALLIDCRSLDYESIPINFHRHQLVICNTNVKHDLATSEYNQRRRECEEAVEILRRNLPHIRSLRDVSVDEFKRYELTLPDVLRKRARHVVTENARTLRCAQALRDGDFDLVGTLLYESHHSLRNDYEVSIPELDYLVRVSQEVPGVCGTRMTGGGFGGCTVSFVDKDSVPDFMRRMARCYEEKFSKPLTVYQVEVVRGADELVL